MKSTEEFKQPTGYIGMILHKGGEWNAETQSLTPDAEIIEKLEFKNLIVNSASTLMAQRLAPSSSTSTVTPGNFIANGLQYLAVGQGVQESGQSGFDFMNPQPAAVTNVKLRDELFRKTFTSWSFIDQGTGASVSSATNIVQVVTTFLEAEAVGPIVEMGLYGGNATATKDSGFMFNYKTFPVWNKPADARLIVSRVA
ncbi:MAG: hypothetical protein K0R18_109 [Bacillales bacterium]|jgi:hypothetical protein|nr:hypothetical protein [Bacillales bacterium]